jgi:hypothetical protein
LSLIPGLVDYTQAERGLGPRCDPSLMNRQYKTFRLTAVKVAGRNRIVTAAIVRIAALSRDVARATIFESSAIALMAALSLLLASASCKEALAICILRALSFWAIRL